MSLFHKMKTARERLDENVWDVQVGGDINKRVSDLEDSAYADRLIGGGAEKIGTIIVSRGGGTSLYAKMCAAYFSSIGDESVVERVSGLMIGRAKDLRSGGGIRMSDVGAIALRDWLLKEFPLEAPKPAPKKKGK